MSTASYVIPSWNMTRLLEQLEKLNKRASKLGVDPVQVQSETDHLEYEYQVLGSGMEDHRVWVREGEVVLEGKFQVQATGRIREFLKVTVTGDAPKYAGWSLIGVLEPLDVDGTQENVVQTVPGYEVPLEYRDRVGECDHCNQRRIRKQTFVVLHDNGDHKVVGRSCLKDFLGHQDPHALASWAELLSAFSSRCKDAQDEDWMGGGCRQPEAWSLEHFLTITSAVIRDSGWVSKSMAFDYGKTATVSMVMFVLCPPSKSFRTAEDDEYIEKIKTEAAKEAHVQRAQEAIEWVLGLSETDLTKDYPYNLNLLARAGYVTHRSSGFAASMVAACARAKERELEKARKAVQSNEHVGEVGQRQNFTVTVERIISVEGRFGSTGIHRMVDEKGNCLVWFASGSSDWLDENQTYVVKGTVTKHDAYNGRNQTVINRVKIVKEVQNSQDSCTSAES